MRLRSLLFVPGDSERKQEKGLSSGADAIILDLEDSVAPARLPVARDQVSRFLQQFGARSPSRKAAAAPRTAGPGCWVRVNALSSGEMLQDLAAVVGAHPDGIVIPKIASAAEALRIHHSLSALEAREGLDDGTIRLILIATETPQAVLSAEPFSGLGERLAGVTWGHEDLSSALGATERMEPDGSLGFTFRFARTVCLLRASASRAAALDTVYTHFRDAAGLAREASRARADGFSGKLAIHPDQVPVINEAFTPKAEEIEHARRVVAAFEADPSAGVVGLDGRMLDRPHLTLARRVLELAGQTPEAG